MIEAHQLTKRYGDKTAVEISAHRPPWHRDRLSRAQRRR